MTEPKPVPSYKTTFVPSGESPFISIKIPPKLQ